jgi:hypothetical protein
MQMMIRLQKCPTRPLILIGHNFGGLVVLKVWSILILGSIKASGSPSFQALCDAYDERAEWPDLFNSVVGMIFLGTPFRGADGMSQSRAGV